MLKALCPAEQITIRGQPSMDRGGHPDDRQHSLAPLWGYLLLDSLPRLFALRLFEGNNFPSRVQSAYHGVDVAVKERPTYGPGRPSSKQPRVVKALRYNLQVALHERAEVIARKTQETGCFVLLTNVPTTGEMAHRAGDVLRAYKEQHGIEQNYGFLKDPLIVKSLFLKKPERIEALGLVLLLALLLWRLVERTLRVHVETTGDPLTGWDKKATKKPTACMMTKFAGAIVIKIGDQRQRAHPLSTVQQQYLMALRVPVTSFTAPPSG